MQVQQVGQHGPSLHVPPPVQVGRAMRAKALFSVDFSRPRIEVVKTCLGQPEERQKLLLGPKGMGICTWQSGETYESDVPNLTITSRTADWTVKKRPAGAGKGAPKKRPAGAGEKKEDGEGGEHESGEDDDEEDEEEDDESEDEDEEEMAPILMKKAKKLKGEGEKEEKTDGVKKGIQLQERAPPHYKLGQHNTAHAGGMG